MASTGAIIVGTGSTVDRSGGAAWTNPTRIETNDGSAAGATMNSTTDSDWLVGIDLSAPIPAGATIDGIEVVVDAYSFVNGVEIDAVTLWNSGAPIGTAKTPSQTLTGSLVEYTYGGSSDTWGATLSDSVVNASTFGAAVGCGWLSGGSSVGAVDYISMTIYYTEAVVASGHGPLLAMRRNRLVITR